MYYSCSKTSESLKLHRVGFWNSEVDTIKSTFMEKAIILKHLNFLYHPFLLLIFFYSSVILDSSHEHRPAKVELIQSIKLANIT